jgi:serine/threonine protein kinase
LIFLNLTSNKGIKIAGFGSGEKMIESGTLLQNRYLIERQIGEGGMGAVYVAIDERFGSQVAIKETFYKDDELGEAFEREARLLNSLHHPALPHVSDYFAENNGYFLVMQFIEGEDLYGILKREGVFPIKDVLRWTDDLLDALDYLHSQEPPIIHRDIKPQNLKITPRGDIILLDFGLAKLNSEDSSVMKSIFGYSRKYSPLEQIQGTGTDPRSDIFALAATAYHLLTGKPPIEVITRASEIIHGNTDPLQLASDLNKEVPVGVANVLNSALAIHADKRFVSAKAMRQALEHAVKAIASEGAEELPKAIPVVSSVSDVEVIDPVKIENLIAHEPFAANVAINLPRTYGNEKSEPIEIPIPDTLVSSPKPEIVPQESYIGFSNAADIAAKLPPVLESRRFHFAALAALLVCCVFGALYFITKPSSSKETNQTAATQSTTESISDNVQSAAALNASMPVAVDASLLENTEQAKTKSSSSGKAVEKKETVNKLTTPIETTENPKPAPPEAETSRPAPAQNQPRNQPRLRVEDEDEPAADIESIFTGRPADEERDNKQQRKEDRRQQRDEMSEEEQKELRRQRRQERRQRPNGIIIPF